MDIASKYRRAISAVGFQVKNSADEVDTTSPTLTSGSGVPTASEPNGSVYLRNDGTASTSIYGRVSAAWIAVPATDAEVSALAGLVSAADKVPYFTGVGTADVATFTAAGRALVDDADATAQRVTLGVTSSADLASVANAKGASLIGIEDVATQITATTVEGALTEIVDAAQLLVSDLASAANTKGASLIGIEDTATFYAGTNLETVLAEVAVAIGGTSSTVRDYSSSTAVADNDSVVVAVGKLDARVGAYQDQLVTAAITVVGGSGGATDAPLSMQLKRAYDNATSPATTCQVMVWANPVQYGPSQNSVNTVTYSAATVGTIVASGNGWALVATDPAGAFACTVTDSADETIYFRAITAAAVSDLGQRASVVASTDDAATWSA